MEGFLLPCPDLDVLERFARSVLDEPARGVVGAHVGGCGSCRAAVAEIAENLSIVEPFRRAMRAPSASESAGGALERAPRPIPAPERVGAFRIVRELGRGGMGVVYLAEQPHPKRLVALKVIRPGIASEAVLRRFEHEANVLAQLSHPGIAQIFEAGVTDVVAPGGAADRQPYFAMEHVDGERIDRYAERLALSDRERLALVARVCDAVHHAHLKGVVHRDLKPGNVLVPAGADAQPKVLDFGVARLAQPGADSATLETRAGGLVGTIPFMSPEQVAGDPSLVDARSDVYSLGVLAFVLLAGRLPHAVETTSVPEAARIIRDEEPARLGAIAPRFRGDVDAIVAKALERERDRRYQSASELALDIRRCLSSEPVLARPPSVAYQFRKLVARHKAPSALAAALLLSVLGFGVTMSILFAKARRAERSAEAAREEAAREAETANRVSEFLVGLFDEANPYAGRGVDVPVGEVLEWGAARTATELADQPIVQGRLLRTLGVAYARLADFERARTLLEQALDVRRRSLGDADSGVAEILNDLATVATMTGDAARRDSLLAAVTSRRGTSLAADHHEIGRALYALGQVARDEGRGAVAESLVADALAVFRACGDAGRGETAQAMTALGRLHADRGEIDSAKSYYLEALGIRRALLPSESPWLVESLNNLAVLHEKVGEYGEAEALLREVVTLATGRLGSEHPDVALPLSNLAGVLYKMERLDDAEALYRRALAIQRAALPAGHPDLAWRLHNIAVVLGRKGKHAEAEPLLREALAIREATLPRGHWGTAETRSVLGETLAGLGRYREAEPLVLSAHRDLEAARGPADRLTARALGRVAALYDSWGRPDLASAFRARAAEDSAGPAPSDAR